ncbi:Na(+)-translocating NADH-quinone reductase subunit A [Maritalea mediterranea]|uniref:Na(+)-translocating NADH-quinone reductase subunit A n=1 Tax=Maritalea mediterranea TaxID=2909667 RepID=A0ABS9E681_9HYPH|nr:Na(+)-translocating NADH-quinone reductase subunit A [Maritalea mediterranea]MCF4098374.1 Na(+)-translocating NADH-quinone reductase subunit A [Maritalea mediterranea]
MNNGMKIRVRGGLPLPPVGSPVNGTTEVATTERVALLGADYPGMRARILVDQGDIVEAGAPLFEDRGKPGLRGTAPVSGKVLQINMGAKRRLSSIVLAANNEAPLRFDVSRANSNDGVRALMQETGLWTSFRTRPFDRVPSIEGKAAAIFVTATDTYPNAPNPRHVLAGQENIFTRGLAALKHLTQGKLYLCQNAGAALAEADPQIVIVNVSGHHPAGLVGTHINRLHPPTRQGPVWHIGYQDVLALGKVLTEGHLISVRTITLTGEGLRQPRQLQVPMGADLHALARREMTPGQKRILSGPVIVGRECQFLTRYHLQATVLNAKAVAPRHWFFAALRAAAVPEAFVPTEALERALGPKLHVVPLLRALSIGDAETAARLGCLQLAEEDLALATYVTGGEIDFGMRLRSVLDVLEAS